MAHLFLQSLPAFIVLAAVSLTAPPAGAVVIFAYQSTCTRDCDRVGLAAGDAVSGTVGVADSAVVPNAAVLPADLVSFSFDFGTVHVESPPAGGFTLLAELDATANAFSVFVMQTGTTLSPVLGDGFSMDLSLWLAAEDFTCVTFGCDSAAFSSPFATGFEGSLTRVSDVPEPASLLLLLSMLTCLAYAFRNSAAGTANKQT